MASFKDDPDYLGPISATPQKMVEEMLAVAGVTAADVGSPEVSAVGEHHAVAVDVGVAKQARLRRRHGRGAE